MVKICPNEVDWLKFLDHETSPEESRQCAAHLDMCATCRASFLDLAATAGWSHSVIERWTEEGSPKAPLPFWRSWSVARGLVASFLVAGVALAAIPPARNALAAVIHSLQFKGITTVNLTPQKINQIEQGLTQGGTVSLSHYGSIKTIGGHAPQSIPVTEVLSRTGLPNEWPQALGTTGLLAQVIPPEKVVLTLNVPAINQLIKDEGGHHFLPSDVNHVPITVSIPTMVNMTHIDRGSTYALTETRTPSISLPQVGNPRQIAVAIASLPFLPSSLQEALVPLEGGGSPPMPVPNTSFDQHMVIQGGTAALITGSDTGGGTTVVWAHAGVFNRFTYDGTMTSAQFVKEVQQWFP